MYQVELMQIRGERKSMSLKGACGVLPQVGRSFGLLFSEDQIGFDQTQIGLREIQVAKSVLQTTIVLSVDELNEAILFETSNSSYMLKILESAQ
jgi:hypothetical protein